MKIILISTHSFPLPTPNHTGDDVILNLSYALTKLGHEVKLCAPAGTLFHDLLPMRASYGAYPPSSQQCEQEAFNNYQNIFLQADVVHDFSNTKVIAQCLNISSMNRTVETLLGGPWLGPQPPNHLCAWSNAHADRIRRGATDYENTPTPMLAGRNGFPIDNVEVVYGGVDTDFYMPETSAKEDYKLWMNRWHEVKGYKQAIQSAIDNKFRLVLAGEHPDNLLFDHEKNCCQEAQQLASGHNNISFFFLPKKNPDHHMIKRTLYQKAQVLLYPVQFQEPFGLSQVEAMACGTPVIETNGYGSCPEVIGNAITPEQARQRAVELFDISVMAKNYIKVYEKVQK